jgi:hypothetical protein
MIDRRYQEVSGACFMSWSEDAIVRPKLTSYRHVISVSKVALGAHRDIGRDD